jgi:hypothetical protein
MTLPSGSTRSWVARAGWLALGAYASLKTAWALGSTIGIDDVAAWHEHRRSLPPVRQFADLWGTVLAAAIAAVVIALLRTPSSPGTAASWHRRLLQVLAWLGVVAAGPVGVVGLGSVVGPALGLWSEGAGALAQWVFVAVYGAFIVVAWALAWLARADAFAAHARRRY